MILYRLQEEYRPTDHTTQTEEEEQVEGLLERRKNLLFLKPAFLSYWSNAVVVFKRLS